MTSGVHRGLLQTLLGRCACLHEWSFFLCFSLRGHHLKKIILDNLIAKEASSEVKIVGHRLFVLIRVSLFSYSASLTGETQSNKCNLKGILDICEILSIVAHAILALQNMWGKCGHLTQCIRTAAV